MSAIIRDDRGFIMAIAFSLLVHVLGWSQLPQMMPKANQSVPVQTLQIKLGVEEEEAAPTARKVSESVDRLVREQLAPNAPLSERMARRLDKQFSSAKSAPQQFVRERKSLPDGFEKGASLGNSQQSKIDVISSYAQTLALWVQQFKTYPESARAAGVEGEAVVRIRIDRQGNIIYVSLRQKSGHAELDAAVLNMVERANPVPAVPLDYPVQDAFLEFLIPISFKLGKL
jgi:periplasmic protein TonB